MTIIIDNKPCVCEPGEYLLEVAARNGITIPSLCHHDGLQGAACCRVCVVEVEIENTRSIVTACVYPVKKECTVYTGSENVIRNRRLVLSMLRSLAPDSDIVARLCSEHEAPEYSRFNENAGGKCILCTLCAEACRSLGTGAIGTAGRGIDKKVTTPYDEPSYPCVCCASCAAVCPTGAIAVAEDEKERRIWNKALRLKTCKSCGAPMGTVFEIMRASNRVDAEQPELCETCRKKAVAKVMAATYGR